MWEWEYSAFTWVRHIVTQKILPDSCTGPFGREEIEMQRNFVRLFSKSRGDVSKRGPERLFGLSYVPAVRVLHMGGNHNRVMSFRRLACAFVNIGN